MRYSRTVRAYRKKRKKNRRRRSLFRIGGKRA